MKSKPSQRTTKLLGLAAICAASSLVPASAGTFTNNFNTDPSGTVVSLVDPAKWVGTGGVGGTGYVSLTDAVGNQNGTMFIEDLDAGVGVGGFKATFKLRVGDPSGNAADGWSFNFASDLGGSASEEGTGTGLTVTFDTYDNGGAEAPAVDIKVGGTVVQSKKVAKADMLTGAEFSDVRIEYSNGLLNVDFKGVSIYKDLPVGIPPIAGGRFAIGARTGGEYETHWIDDLSIQTFLLTAPSIAAVPANAKGVTVVLQDAPNAAVDATSVKANVDGAAVTGTAVKTGDKTVYNYVSPTLYAPGSVHPVVLTYKYGATGTAGSNSFSITVPSYTIIPAGSALATGSVDTTKRGFAWRVHQADSATTLPNNVKRADDQLGGVYGANTADPAAVGAASGAATAASPATAAIEFKIPGVINLSQAEGDLNGNFTPDLQMPGFAGGDPNNIAAEILTALEFSAAGTYTLIVNSDDGFRTSAGPNPRDVTNPTLGIFDTGRGASDTLYNIYVEAPGLYGFRTVWFEGDGGANIEWLSLTQTGAKVLLNDSANPEAIKAYQLSASALPAFVRSVSPVPDATMINRPTTVEAVLVDGGTQVTANSVKLKLNGADAAVTATKTGTETKVLHTIVGDLLPNTLYTAELSYSDTTGAHTTTWQFTTGLLSSTLFVIEAEDFDYGSGKANPQKGTAGLDVDVMPYYGGAYDTLDAVESVDYLNDDADADGSVYRTELDANGENEVAMYANNNVAGGNGKGGNMSINSSERGSYQTTVNYTIGWAGTPDWCNYTRTFPDNKIGGWWKVYAMLSYGGEADGQLAGSFGVVSAGVGTSDQTVDIAGTFSAPGSGAWGANNLVPMKNASGGDALVKLVGKQTVRYTISSGDYNGLILSAAPPPPPFVLSTTADSSKRNEVIVDWVLKDTDSKVNEKTIKVSFNNQDVTTKAVIAKTDTGATIHLDLSGTTFASGEIPWTLTFSDTSTPAQNVTSTGKYVVNPYPTEGVFTIEAEDYNYESGKTLPEASVMPYAGGAYDNLLGVYDVDYHNQDGNDNGGVGTVGSDAYRHEGIPIPETDADRTHVNISSNTGRYGLDRGTFELTSNYKIGWVTSTDWGNYTRTYPKADYNVWAALSYGGTAAGQLRGSLAMVTSDPSKPSQTLQPLGTFNAPGSGDWGRNELVPMKDATGKIVTVPMEGVKTVRFTMDSGDFDYFLFVPASASTGDQPQFTSVTRTANGVVLTWTGGGTLETAPAVNGPWTAVPTATSPYTLPTTQSAQFARIRR